MSSGSISSDSRVNALLTEEPYCPSEGQSTRVVSSKDEVCPADVTFIDSYPGIGLGEPGHCRAVAKSGIGGGGVTLGEGTRPTDGAVLLRTQAGCPHPAGVDTPENCCIPDYRPLPPWRLPDTFLPDFDGSPDGLDLHFNQCL